MFQGMGAILGSSIGKTFDPDAAAFISAASITDGNQQDAINNLVISAKANGWWSLCYAIYPFVGGTEAKHKFNLKDPRDLDAAFRLSFTGSWTHSSTGALPDGSTAYAETHLSPNSVFGSVDSTHLSYYSRTNESSGTHSELGINPVGGTTSGCYMSFYGSFSSTGVALNSTVNAGPIGPSNTYGHLLITIKSGDATLIPVYQNGSLLSQFGRGSGSLSTATIPIGCNYNEFYSTYTDFTAKECAFATIGQTLTSTQIGNMYTDIQTFQTTLSRQV